MSKAWADVVAERVRQMGAEGFTPEHDDDWTEGQLARAASSYAKQSVVGLDGKITWPFDLKWWKPSTDPRRNLVKAGALILAEIERLDREAARAGLAD